MNEGKPDCNGCLYTGELYDGPHGYSNCWAPNGEYWACIKRFREHPEDYEEGDDYYEN